MKIGHGAGVSTPLLVSPLVYFRRYSVGPTDTVRRRAEIPGQDWKPLGSKKSRLRSAATIGQDPILQPFAEKKFMGISRIVAATRATHATIWTSKN
jgi:hypothetical protein